MPDEIDLRKYILAIIRGWKILIALALISAGIAFTLTTFQKDTYTATAVIVLNPPPSLMAFDLRFGGIEMKDVEYKSILDLASSDEILRRAYEQWKQTGSADDSSLRDFRGAAKAANGSNPTIVNLTVTLGNAKASAELANAWANALASRVNAIYSGIDPETQAALQAQKDGAEMRATAAAQALADFESQNQTTIGDNELTALIQAHADYLTAAQKLSALDQDCRDLIDQLKRETGDALSLADQINATLIQLRAFNQFAPTLEINTGNLLGAQTRTEQIAGLENILTTISARQEQTTSVIKDLAPQIDAMQQKSRALNAQKDILQADYNVALQTYQIVSAKLDEITVAISVGNLLAHVASEAQTPQSPVSQKWETITLIASLAGFVLGMLIIVARIWWREGPQGAASA
jgi:uncharacterized protein involved in exopolysaccharide biosynthesis